MAIRDTPGILQICIISTWEVEEFLAFCANLKTFEEAPLSFLFTDNWNSTYWESNEITEWKLELPLFVDIGTKWLCNK